MTVKRRFYQKGLQHVFQITDDNGLLFYTDADIIVFFSILCCFAVKYRVTIVSLCIMKNHFHILAHFDSLESMEKYMNAVCSVFARLYNKQYHRQGKLFSKSFGSAPKYSDKDICDCIAYILNNPVPKRAADNALGYRWNFLAYMDSQSPFSAEIKPSDVPERLRPRIMQIEKHHGSGHYIDYQFFYSLVNGLDPEQYEQVLDKMISIYNTIDYGYIKSRWKTKDSISDALDLLKGKEYDMAEDSSHEDYRTYGRMDALVAELGFDLSHTRFDSERLDVSEMDLLRRKLLYRLRPTLLELDKYFHTGRYSRRLRPKPR